MKTRKIICIFLSALFLLSLCACSGGAPLYSRFDSENIKNFGEKLPQKMNVTVSSGNINASAYNIADSELMQKTAEAFMKITAHEKVSEEDFTCEYSLDLFFENETVSVCIGNGVAEIGGKNGAQYYRIKNYEKFEKLLSKMAQAQMEASDSENLVSSQNVTVDVSQNGYYDDNGNYVVEVNVLNNLSNIISLCLTDCRVGDEKLPDSDFYSVSGKSEVGFLIPIPIASPEGKVRISFKAQIILGTDETAEPYLISDKYEITVNI